MLQNLFWVFPTGVRGYEVITSKTVAVSFTSYKLLLSSSFANVETKNVITNSDKTGR